MWGSEPKQSESGRDEPDSLNTETGNDWTQEELSFWYFTEIKDEINWLIK